MKVIHRSSVSSSRQVEHKRYIIYNRERFVALIVISCLTFFTLFTPRDVLNLKKISLAASLLISIVPILSGIRKSGDLFCASLVYPLILTIVSTLKDIPISKIASYLYCFSYLLLIFPIEYWKINIQKTTIICIRFIAFVIVLSCLLDSFKLLDITRNPLLVWLNNNGEAQVSKSANALLRYVIFLNASPIILLGLTYSVSERNYGEILFMLAALLFTGTRANTCLAVAVIVYMIFDDSKRWEVRALVIISAVILCMIFGAELYMRLQTLNSAKASGDVIRMGTFNSIIDALNGGDSYWLTGMGFGSEYYNIGRLMYVETSELSYLEFIREAGVPLSIIMFFIILYPICSLRITDRSVFAFYIAYLIAGFFEPFIFTSTGFFVIMLVYISSRKRHTIVHLRI